MFITSFTRINIWNSQWRLADNPFLLECQSPVSQRSQCNASRATQEGTVLLSGTLEIHPEARFADSTNLRFT